MEQTEKLMAIIASKLEKDNWGTIEPSDFTPDGEYYNDLSKIIKESFEDFYFKKNGH